ncbi:hypothetical protein HRbin06_00095 [archaeon HR06]|nr:hypothetical protein HRbin06_00095 [archaeon HR06]
MPLVHLGLDDTDSKEGMCTTYVAYLIIKEILKERVEFLDFPNLIRLNPAIPWKTRGNGAVALRFYCEDPEEIFSLACKVVKENSQVSFGANSCLALLEGEIPKEIRALANDALYKVVNFKRAKKLAKGLKLFSLGKGHGLIGALAAIGNTLEEDYTFEILVYRKRENFGKKRMIDRESVIRMDKETYPLTFNNYDYEKDRILITPHGPDPVLLGIRGEDPEVLIKALKILKIDEEWDGYLIFRTNQGTNHHLRYPLNLKDLKAYTCGYVRVKVSSNPWRIRGGHVFFEAENEDGKILCAVYEPTGSLNDLASKLIKGDELELGGSIRRNTKRFPKTLNVEYIKVLKLAKNVKYLNPLCDKCKKRMKSLGKNKGFECEDCKLRKYSKEKLEMERDIKLGLYLPPPRAHRHLTKPYQRYYEKNWFLPYSSWALLN